MNKPTVRGEQGIVSLMVTIILMLVISLIVISFARTSRREQRDSLDRQLSTNAFYAAESGVNAARKAIASDIASGGDLLKKEYTSDCTGPSSFADSARLQLPSDVTASNSRYTCIFVDPTVSSIEHTKTSEPFSFPLKSADTDALGSVDFYWDAGMSGASYSSCPRPNNNPPTWPVTDCGSGVLRLELTDTNNLNQNYVYFIYPGKIANNITYKAPGHESGSTYEADCKTDGMPKQCHFKLSGLNNTAYARVSSLYMDYALTVQANGNKKFADAQIVVDATGKAADVQRRIQVRYSLNDFGGPTALLQSGASMCKKFSIDGTNVTDQSGSYSCWGSGSTQRSGNTTLP